MGGLGQRRGGPVSPLSQVVFEASLPSNVAYLNGCEVYGSEGSVGSGFEGLLGETEGLTGRGVHYLAKVPFQVCFLQEVHLKDGGMYRSSHQ